MSQKIIIRGHVFDYAEKAPFVASGMSVLGALEFNETADKVKCHECGTWIGGLGNHIKRHGLRRADYNAKHGLRRFAALSAMGTRKKHSVNGKAMAANGTGIKSPRAIVGHMQSLGHTKGQSMPRTAEHHNERAKCAAQLLFRIQTLAAQNGRTPTTGDLRSAGLEPWAIRQRFGSVEAAMNKAGLEPNSHGCKPSDLPRGFPSESEIKDQWNSRMPWPEDYFQIRPLERRRDLR